MQGTSAGYPDYLRLEKPAPWRAGIGLTILSSLLWLWYLSLILRFLNGSEAIAASIWLAILIGAFPFYVTIARLHLPERSAPFLPLPTMVQSTLFPGMFSLGLALIWSDLGDAAVSVAHSVTATELVAIHILRLAAWGTIKKWMEGKLPNYFLYWGSIPDFGFAILSIFATLAMLTGLIEPSPNDLIVWTIIGLAAWIGAGVTMNFGVPGGPWSWRWKYVEQGLEPPTLLPFRWPMNLAPAYVSGFFYVAHFLLLLKSING